MRSYSLSEDGPVVGRSPGYGRLLDGPDPVSMLSDGDYKALGDMRSKRGARGGGARTPTGSSSSAEAAATVSPGASPEGEDSERSAAATCPSFASSGGGHHSESEKAAKAFTSEFEDLRLTLLSPILSKLGNHLLEVVPELPDSGASAGGGVPLSRFRKQHSEPVPATKVKALRGRSNLLHLSQVTLPYEESGNRSPRILSARSDLSFGSACSAFTSIDSSCSGGSPPSSASASASSLAPSASMPSLRRKQPPYLRSMKKAPAAHQ